MQLQKRSPRRGTTLVLFAFLVFAFMALAALAIDMGLARLAQRQMWTATDTLALEAVRNESVNSVDPNRPPDPRTAAVTFGSYFNGALPGDSSSLAAQFLQNVDNNPQGDLVRGSFDTNQLTFTPDAPDTPAASAGTAFQVQLRRSNDLPIPDELSTGLPVPYLFGQGSLLGSALKARGITVRAKSVANGQPVLSVGLPDDSNNLYGLAPYGLNLTFWKALPDSPAQAGPGDQSVLLTIADSGQLTNSAIDPNGGWLMQVPTQGPVVIGDSFSQKADDASTISNFQRFVPIFSTIGSETVILGFGYLEGTRSGNTLSLIKRSKAIAPNNASTVPVRALNLPGSLTAQDKNTFFSLIPLTPSLLAPALVR